MRTVTLSFKKKKFELMCGIKVKWGSSKSTLDLFANQERAITLPINEESPPLVMSPISEPAAEQLYLVMLSLVAGHGGELHASLEIDTHEKVLLLIDPIDDECAQCNTGAYTFPSHHDERLPKLFWQQRHEPSKYGLVVCGPRDTCIIRSTSGHLVKIMLGEHGKFSRIPCDERDRFYMDGRP